MSRVNVPGLESLLTSVLLHMVTKPVSLIRVFFLGMIIIPSLFFAEKKFEKRM